MELDLQICPEEITSRDGGGAGLSKLDLFCFELSKPCCSSTGHCLCDCPSTAVEIAIAQGISRCMGNGEGTPALTGFVGNWY